MSSYAYTPSTMGGISFDQGARGLTELGNKYPNNEAVGGLVTGSFADAFRTQMNMGTALSYNTAMSSHMSGLQQGFENLRTGNTMKLMGAEGRIAKDLIGAQGAQQRLGIQETGTQQRMNIGAQGSQDRMNIGAQGTQDRLNLGVKGSEDRKSIRTAGGEERLNIGKRYQEERNMRSDARGAIRSLGARFFG